MRNIGEKKSNVKREEHKTNDLNSIGQTLNNNVLIYKNETRTVCSTFVDS